MMGAADVNGFIPGACHTVERYVLCEEGAAGMVDAEYVLYWVRNYLVPYLGNYHFGEPCSVVFLDNASSVLT